VKCFLLLVTFFLGTVGRATTVMAPSFDELVRESELIFRGRVTAVKSDWSGEGKGRAMATWVTFTVERTLRGNVAETITLEFMGGEVGQKRLVLAGWPKFEVGDRGVFFVENREGRVCPLMRLRHGKYRIVSESDNGGAVAGTAGAAAGVERVLRDDGTPLRVVAEVSAALGENVAGESVLGAAVNMASEGRSALTLVDFEAQVTARSAALPLTQEVVR
jgi:hypothetical protein